MSVYMFKTFKRSCPSVLGRKEKLSLSAGKEDFFCPLLSGLGTLTAWRCPSGFPALSLLLPGNQEANEGYRGCDGQGARCISAEPRAVPRRPMTTSINEDMMMAPWIWSKRGHRRKSKLLINHTLNVTCNHN